MASLGTDRNVRTWMDQDEAIVHAARYLGFKNTGKRIQHRLKHAIRLLIRDGVLERNGKQIRRTSPCILS